MSSARSRKQQAEEPPTRGPFTHEPYYGGVGERLAATEEQRKVWSYVKEGRREYHLDVHDPKTGKYLFHLKFDGTPRRRKQ